MTECETGLLADPGVVPEWLRPLLRRTADIDAGDFGWPRTKPPRQARPAAVLVLFGEGTEGPDVLLLRRADGLHAHPGQVAFPGGAVDEGDTGPVSAAVREAVEEVGVLPAGIRPVALLPELHLSYSGFRVTPVVAHWSDPSPVQAVDPAETAAVARVPVSTLIDPSNRFMVRFQSGRAGPAFVVPGMLVWGFTGGLLSGLLDLAGWSVEWDRTDVRTLDEAWRAAESSSSHPSGKGHG